MADALTIRTRFRKGNATERLRDELVAIQRDLAPQLNKLATSTYRYLERYIDSHRKRKKDPSKPRLATAFKNPVIDFRLHSVTFSIGDKTYLDAQFPYWKLLEDGGEVWTNKTGAPGWFGHKQRPTAGMLTTDLFNYNPNTQGNFLLTGVHRIEGIGYIKATNAWLSRQWGLTWSAYVRNRKYAIPTFRKSKAVNKTQLTSLKTPSTTISYTDIV